MRRLIHAFTFNEIQFVSVSLFTAANICAVSERKDAPLWLWLIAGLLYPSIAVVSNFFSWRKP